MIAKENRNRLALLTVLLLVGCTTGPGNSAFTGRGQPMSDPLRGGPAVDSLTKNGTLPPDRTGLTYGTGVGSPSRPAGPLASLPSPTASTSPAALTSGTTGQLDAAPALRIGTDPRGDTAWRGPGETPRATLQAPTPTPPGEVTPSITIPSPSLKQVHHRVGGLSLEQLKAQLTRLGVTEEGWNKANGEVNLTCRVPNPKNPNLMQVYEATADSEVAAIEAVVEQIQQERR